MLITSNWSNVSFKVDIYLLNFCLDDLSIVDSGIFRSPIVIVFLSGSFFSSVSRCFIYFGAP